MSEKERLIKRLVDAGVANFHVTPGTNWQNLTVEERARALNESLDRLEDGLLLDEPPLVTSPKPAKQRKDGE